MERDGFWTRASVSKQKGAGTFDSGSDFQRRKDCEKEHGWESREHRDVETGSGRECMSDREGRAGGSRVVTLP